MQLADVEASDRRIRSPETIAWPPPTEPTSSGEPTSHSGSGSSRPRVVSAITSSSRSLAGAAWG